MVAEHSQSRAVQPDIDVTHIAHLALQQRGDVDPSCSRVNGIDGTEETMGLKDELASQPLFVIDEEYVDPTLSQLDCR